MTHQCTVIVARSPQNSTPTFVEKSAQDQLIVGNVFSQNSPVLHLSRQNGMTDFGSFFQHVLFSPKCKPAILSLKKLMLQEA